jgi:hypothetical protein
MNTSEILEWKAHSVLMFLLAHDEADAHHVGLDLSTITANGDVKGTVTVEGQKFVLKLSNGMTFESANKYQYYTRTQCGSSLFLYSPLTFHILNSSDPPRSG